MSIRWKKHFIRRKIKKKWGYYIILKKIVLIKASIKREVVNHYQIPTRDFYSHRNEKFFSLQ